MSLEHDTKRNICACIFLAVVVVTVFWPVVRYDFVSFDDPQYVSANAFMPDGLTGENVKKSFFWFYGMWTPVTILSYLVDAELYGINAHGFHLTNILIHVVNTGLLFLVLHAMTGSFWASVLVAALFGVHPLHVEPVAWISSRKDVLSTFFWFATMGLYLRYVKTPSTGRFVLVLLSFTLGMLAKPMLMTLPFALLLLDYWPLERFGFQDFHTAAGRKRLGEAVLEKCVLLPVVPACFVVTYYTQASSGAVSTFTTVPLTTRIGNATVGYAAYIVDTVWPVGLAFLYPLPLGGHPIPIIVAAAILLAAATVGAAWCARKRPYVLVGWLWYVGTLVPVIGLIQLGSQMRADRYTYVPLIGLFIVLAWGLAEWAERRPRHARGMGALCAAALIALMVVSSMQVTHWANSETLYRRAIAVTENNLTAHYNLAIYLEREIRTDEAIAEYEKCLTITPNHPGTHINLGAILARRGEMDAAIAHFNAALEFAPNNSILLLNMALAYRSLGEVETAHLFAEKAVEVAPNSPDARMLYEAIREDLGLLETPDDGA